MFRQASKPLDSSMRIEPCNMAHQADSDEQTVKSFSGSFDACLNYNEAKALTTSEVDELKEGDILHGWTCTSLEYFPLQKTVYCTDQGTEINALDFSAYKSVSTEQHDYQYPSSRYYTLKDPTPAYNCFSHTFIDGEPYL